MKILCPVDFSESSVYAVDYALRLFNEVPDLQVTLAHCFNIASRSGMFLKMDELLRENAEKDMAALVKPYQETHPQVSFNTEIFKGDPKHRLPEYASINKFDFVVVGTKGMSEVKDILIGSLTDSLFEHATAPIIAVPFQKASITPQKVLLALDHKVIDNDKVLHPLKSILSSTSAQLHMCHVQTKDDGFSHDPLVELELGDLAYEYKLLEAQSKASITKTISDHLDNIDAQMMVLIHRHRPWWKRWFTKSNAKEELFNLDATLLVLHG